MITRHSGAMLTRTIVITAGIVALALIGAAPVPAAFAGEDPSLLEELKSYPHSLIFETNRDGNWELYVMNADGSGVANLTRTPKVNELNPRVSPDGRRIAFAADTLGKYGWRRDVFIMATDGSSVTKIADHARDPCWSPDGAEVAYLPAEYGRFSYATWATRGLRVYTLATGETRDHPNRGLEHLYTLSFSPDGRWLFATVHGGMGFRHSVIAIESDGEAVHDLSLMGCRSDVTGDGSRIAWGHGDYAIGVGELSLSAERPRVGATSDLVSGRDGNQTYHVDWSPDGRYIVFSYGPKLPGAGLLRVTPQCPGVIAPGWNLCVADTSSKDRWVALTSDGQSNKEADWVPVLAPGAR